MDKKNHTASIIAALFIFSILLTLVNYHWIRHNLSHLPPPWDTAFYIHMGINDYAALTHSGIVQFVRTFILQAPTLAPLFPATAIPFFALFGISINTAYLCNSIYIFVLLASVFFIADHLGGRKAGYISVFLVATFPAVIVFSRDFLFEFPLASLTAISYLFLIKSDGFKKRREAVFCGICTGLSVLTKTMGVVFFVVPFFYGLVVFSLPKSNQTIRKNILLCYFSAFLVASIFYLPNIREIFGYLFYFGLGKGSMYYNSGISDMLSLRYWTVYIQLIAERGVSYEYAILFVISLLMFLLSKGGKPSLGYLLVWLWLVCGYLLLSVPQNKGGERYALPILPPISILMATHIMRLRLQHLKLLLIALVLAVGTTNYVYQTSSERCQYNQFSFKHKPVLIPVHVTCNMQTEAGMAEDGNWNLSTLLEYMDGLNGGRFKTIPVLIAVDHYFLNGNNLQLYAALGKLKGRVMSDFQFETVAYKPFRPEEMRQLIDKSLFIITKTGFQGPDFSNINNSLVKTLIGVKPPLKSFAMSDGSTVSIYENSLVKG